MINFVRLHHRAQEWELVLNGLMHADIHTLGGRGRYHWVRVPNGQAGDFRVAYCPEMYHYPGCRAFRRPTLPWTPFLPWRLWRRKNTTPAWALAPAM